MNKSILICDSLISDDSNEVKIIIYNPSLCDFMTRMCKDLHYSIHNKAKCLELFLKLWNCFPCSFDELYDFLDAFKNENFDLTAFVFNKKNGDCAFKFNRKIFNNP